MGDLERRIRTLEKKLADAERRLEQRPVLSTVTSAQPYMVLTIIDGNELETGQDGCNYAEDVTSVPTAYDPTVDDSFIDGICRATLHINGVAQADYVLVVNDARGTFGNALLAGDQIFTQGSVSIPVDGGGSVRAYVAG